VTTFRRGGKWDFPQSHGASLQIMWGWSLLLSQKEEAVFLQSHIAVTSSSGVNLSSGTVSKQEPDMKRRAAPL